MFDGEAGEEGGESKEAAAKEEAALPPQDGDDDQTGEEEADALRHPACGEHHRQVTVSQLRPVHLVQHQIQLCKGIKRP